MQLEMQRIVKTGAAETTKTITEDHSHGERKIKKITGKKRSCSKN